MLMSEELIAVNQDPLGTPGDLIWKQGSDEVRLLKDPCDQGYPIVIHCSCTTYFECRTGQEQLTGNGLTYVRRHHPKSKALAAKVHQQSCPRQWSAPACVTAS